MDREERGAEAWTLRKAIFSEQVREGGKSRSTGPWEFWKGVVKDVRSEYLGEHISGTDVNKADYGGWGARDEELKMVRQAYIISSLAWWEDWYLEQNLEWDQGWIFKKKKTKTQNQKHEPVEQA